MKKKYRFKVSHRMNWIGIIDYLERGWILNYLGKFKGRNGSRAYDYELYHPLHRSIDISNAEVRYYHKHRFLKHSPYRVMGDYVLSKAYLNRRMGAK